MHWATTLTFVFRPHSPPLFHRVFSLTHTHSLTRCLPSFAPSSPQLGTRLHVTSTILQLGRYTATVNVKVTDADSGRVVVHATHVKQDVARAPETAKKLGMKLRGEGAAGASKL